MRFHVLLPVRDEADIVGQCLGHLLSWADTVHVFDTGSVDETWEIVRDAAARDRRIRLLGKDEVYFCDTRVRGWMFERARREMRDGDWFLRVDADEIHHVPPPDFLRTRLRPHETCVYHQYYDFRLTACEAAAWEAGEETPADRARPIDERRRRYTISAYSEPRLCRYRETMRWPPEVSFPYNAGYVARARLPIRHYPHRDPVQLARRCRVRAVMMSDAPNRANWTHPEEHHWSEADWRAFVTPDDAPGLRSWEPGTDLPEPGLTGHLKPWPIRALQRTAHACLLPLLDRLRPPPPRDAYPRRMPPAVARRLQTELAAPSAGTLPRSHHGSARGT
jgi:hypothetical protein